MRLLLFSYLTLVLSAAAGDKPRPGLPEAKMSWLDNGHIRLGCDLDFGGAITWVSKSGSSENLINNFDAGRQVQLSFFSGPEPFESHGQKPSDHWKHLGWNPIQAGDVAGNGSRVTSHKNDGKKLSVTCVPLQWPLRGVDGECEYDVEIVLDGFSASIHSRMRNRRTDTKWYRARHQELPAIYTNGKWHRIQTYSGEHPFSGGALTTIPSRPEKGSHPWSSWHATENWAALVDDHGEGLGVWSPGTILYTGGFAGQPGSADTFGNDTGYLAPLRTEHIGPSEIYEFRYSLILGSVEEIRSFAAQKNNSRSKTELPEWQFSKNREGWISKRDPILVVADSGHLTLQPKESNTLYGPLVLWKAIEAPLLEIRYQWTPPKTASPNTKVHVFWRKWDEKAPQSASFVSFEIEESAQWNTVLIPLHKSDIYRGTLCQLRIDLPAGDWMLDEIRFLKQEPAKPVD